MEALFKDYCCIICNSYTINPSREHFIHQHKRDIYAAERTNGGLVFHNYDEEIMLQYPGNKISRIKITNVAMLYPQLTLLNINDWRQNSALLFDFAISVYNGKYKKDLEKLELIGWILNAQSNDIMYLVKKFHFSCLYCGCLYDTFPSMEVAVNHVSTCVRQEPQATQLRTLFRPKPKQAEVFH